MHPIVGITTYGRDERPTPSDHYASHFSVPTDYVDAVRRAGGVAVLLPPGETSWERWLGAVDAVVVTGGADVGASHYGGGDHPKLDKPDEQRDHSELTLADALVDADIPSLFVCRGLQILNVARGGTLHQHVPDIVEDIHRNEAGLWTYHDIEAEEGSLVAKAMGTQWAKPCSGHHQAIDRLGRDLVVTASAPDGIVEAVEMPGAGWLLGVQWHPEVSAGDDPSQQGIFDAFVAAAAG